MKLIFTLLLISTLSITGSAQHHFKAPGNKMLVVSGGGARGAWGVGLISELYKKNGGYKIVYGTSTGSLMAPFVLLQKFDTLKEAYSKVNQHTIFNISPFKVKYNPTTKTVTTKLRVLNGLYRGIFKKTLGTTDNLKELIEDWFTKKRYDSLIDFYKSNNMMLAVAVTNMRTGALEIKTDSSYSKSKEHYEEMVNWIWASSNEPLFMSYVEMNDPAGKKSYYVDGGLRRVIPVEEALRYAINHNIDTIDVVINNSKIPEKQNWDKEKESLMGGLLRILSIYNSGTVTYNVNYADLLRNYINDCGKFPPPPPKHLNVSILASDGVASLANAEERERQIVMKFYWMADDVAARYPDELGFIEEAMIDLIREGEIAAKSKDNRMEFIIKEKSVREVINNTLK
ncbi:MAG: patatin-like phospholipase family protein [Cyclobacteriaceae bacterium]|nr:patatin-like phospholipase family protein [Cyclobacteriaceae bacterium]